MAEYRTPGVTVSESLKARETGTTNPASPGQSSLGQQHKDRRCQPLSATGVSSSSCLATGEQSSPAPDAEEPSKQMVDAAYVLLQRVGGCQPLDRCSRSRKWRGLRHQVCRGCVLHGNPKRRRPSTSRPSRQVTGATTCRSSSLKPTSLAPGADGETTMRSCSRASASWSSLTVAFWKATTT